MRRCIVAAACTTLTHATEEVSTLEESKPSRKVEPTVLRSTKSVSHKVETEATRPPRSKVHLTEHHRAQLQHVPHEMRPTSLIQTDISSLGGGLGKSPGQVFFDEKGNAPLTVLVDSGFLESASSPGSMEAVGDLFGGVQQLFRHPNEEDILPPIPRRRVEHKGRPAAASLVEQNMNRTQVQVNATMNKTQVTAEAKPREQERQPVVNMAKAEVNEMKPAKKETNGGFFSSALGFFGSFF